MQGQVGGIRQSTEPSGFANQGYNSGNNLFARPAGASRQVWPRDTKTRRSQRICECRLGENGIYEDVTWIQPAWSGTQA